jgi:TRAP-type C4-dicarboxylate transport system permease small subunit
MESPNTKFDDKHGMGRIIRQAALAGGFVLIFISSITVISVIGRYAFGAPITGDYEIVEFGVSIAVFAFLPYTHASNNNIIAGFFTSGLPQPIMDAIDGIQNIIFLLVICLLAYTAIIGGIDKYNANEISMFLSMQVWWLHAFGVIGLTLVGWVALWKIIKWRSS